MKFLEQWATKITCIWLWTTLGVLVLNPNKPFNETGDFMAGMMAPLALFWLVIGFYLQREELAQNTKALLLQAEELKNLVQHNARLVALRESEEEPLFIPTIIALAPPAGDKRNSKIGFKNVGGQAINIIVSAEGKDSIRLTKGALNTNEVGTILIEQGRNFWEGEVKLSYENNLGRAREIIFDFLEKTTYFDLYPPFTNPTKIDEGEP